MEPESFGAGQFFKYQEIFKNYALNVRVYAQNMHALNVQVYGNFMHKICIQYAIT